MATEVHLNLYSGRPGPKWHLDEEQTQELVRRLRSCEALGEEAGRQRLGYSGFMVLADPDSGLPGLIEIFRGLIASPEGTLLDRDRELERWLLETAGTALSPEIQELVLRELEE